MHVYHSNTDHIPEAEPTKPKPPDDISLRAKLLGYGTAFLATVVVLGAIIYQGTEPVSYNAIKNSVTETYEELTK